MKSISDDDLCSNCTHCSYVPSADRHECAHRFPGVEDDDDYVISCAKFEQRVTQHDLVRAAVYAKRAYWAAANELGRSYDGGLTATQNSTMRKAVGALAASALGAEHMTNENAQKVLDAIAAAK